MDLSAQSIDKLRQKLQADNKALLEYLTLKIGFDPKNSYEYQMAMLVHTKYVHLLQPDGNPYVYLCQMAKNVCEEDLLDCVNSNAPQPKPSQLFLSEE